MTVFIIGANCTCTHDVSAHSLIYNKQCASARKIEVLKGTFTYLSEKKIKVSGRKY